MSAKKSKTERVEIGDRGLGKYLEARDTKGERFRVQDSSAAMEQCVWIFTDQVIGEHLGKPDHAALHFNTAGARELIEALEAFLAFAEADEKRTKAKT